MSICTYILKRYGEGIAATNGAGSFTKGICDLHRLILTPKKCASQKADTMCHRTPCTQEGIVVMWHGQR